MIKFVYPEKDTFISNHPTLIKRNFGKDEILEIENRQNYIVASDLVSYDAESRALIKFNLTNISQSISTGQISNPKFVLSMKVSQFDEVPQDFSIIVNPISQSWSVGTGRYADEIETNGVSWIYRFAESQSWSGDTLTSTNGGTWYTSLTSQSFTVGTGSIEILSLNVGDNFYLTSSTSEIYTFSSNYNYTSQSKGYPSASVEITSISNFDRFTVKGTQTSSISVVNKFTPNSCGSENFIGWDSDITSDSTTVLQFTTESLYSGKKFVIYDSFASWSFIASNNPSMPDLGCNTRFFTVGNDNYENVVSFSMEINEVEDFYITSAVSTSYDGTITSSFLILSSSYLGELGNDSFFLDMDEYTVSSTTDTCGNVTETRVYSNQNFVGGSGTGKYSRFNQLADALSAISSSHGFTFTTNGFTINFTSLVSGSIAEQFSFSSGSIETFFDGSYVSSSYSLFEDEIASNNYYFETGSGLTSSLDNLIEKINNTVNFVTVGRSGSTLILTGSSGQSTIGFQSGSTSVILSAGTEFSTISSTRTQYFLNEVSDLSLDVTPIVNSWLTNQIPNEGFILRNELLNNNIDSGKVRFYSMDSNTIYIPRLEVRYDDQVFNPVNLEPFTLEKENVVKIKSIKPSYKNTDVEKFRILSRIKYPEKTYANEFSRYTTTSYLPRESQYAIKDAESEEYVISFGESTKISCDSSGSYFVLDMSTLPQERFYTIYIKVIEDNLTEVFESGKTFKISR